MTDALAGALTLPGLGWLAVAYLIGGLIRGFSGFGTALVVVPVAGALVDPVSILVMVAVTGLVSNVVLVPGAWRHADHGEVGILAGAAILGVPLGIWIAGRIDTDLIRWAVAALGAVTVASLALGWQVRARMRAPGLAGVGAAAGLVGGLTALTGPIAILFYLANARRAVAVRANMILFLAALDVLLLVNVAALGGLSAASIALGLVLCAPYVSGIALGMALFDPARERAYRGLALTIVAGAMLAGLPIRE